MLEIFNETGKATLSIDDNTTRILAVYKKSVNQGFLPSEFTGPQIRSKRERVFMVANSLFDVSDNVVEASVLVDPSEHLTKNDLVILGVYNV